MDGLRWTGSERLVIDTADIETLAVEGAEEIFNDQYDGYTAWNRQLAEAIAYKLCCMTLDKKWRVYADSVLESKQWLYKVWVE